GIDSGGERALEARHHVAREQLVAPERLLARGPLVRAEEQPAETALRILDEPLDALDGRLGGADQGRAHLHALAQRIVGAAPRLREVGPALAPPARGALAPRGPVGVGAVPVPAEPPLAAVHRLAVLRRGLLADPPLLRDRLRAARQSGSEREHAEAVLAGRHH